MTELSLMEAAPRGIMREVLHRQRTLATYGLVLLLLAPVLLVMQQVDLRTWDGSDVWVKPTKFVVSVAVLALTNAWFFGYVRPDRRRAPSLRAIVPVIIAAGSFEIIYIAWQAGHGLASHFNKSSPFYAIMYGLMGLGALLLVASTLPLAWEIARRPAQGLSAQYVAAVVIGLTLCFVLGGGSGGYMAQQPGHAVGLVGGHAPLFGWNRAGGDLRIAHFLGIHAQQAIPILGLGVAALPLRLRWPALVGGSLAYGAISIALFIQALNGHPLLPDWF
ncbi:MAG TPA: hypothetical protein VHS76_11785 [Steroidobacteraceae bacterium]|jgi:hypothetical protein|nr:hypothetical protein [Steroidobacteraceae bacterium]